MQERRLVIISGLSGSGKSVALATLEDAGFYCIDNLPVALLEAFGAHITADGQSGRYAVGIDARNRPEDLARFPEILATLEDHGIACEIVFLDAAHDTLLKRFSETRRRHPLSGPEVPLGEAITGERELLMPLLERADLTLDTTHTTVHQLRDIVRDRLARAPHSLSLLLESFGYKHGTPPDADFVFDARCLPNPHWQPDLRPLTGRDPAVAEYLGASELVGDYLEHVGAFLSHWLPAFRRENRSYLTIAIGCTGGQHRSVYLAEHLARRFREEGVAVTVRHRELS
ncbi:RNase adapter RapZ [Sediminicurvatus halobius]|uniref:RNase adapter RapZ n=1 Tax=Sediminicurvatus halobius TaxID=2182432 RepID=A0A2U2N7U9_9GAMM|nr:RNase adapter RapZ [Spiribacter halobius]PWG65210.1 RNase adapter RapZ [Spiribacter halobius]UEX78835.1 RNase adapter RapZ [Spiribacter halobius]